jgi:hypothetical protein
LVAITDKIHQFSIGSMSVYIAWELSLINYFIEEEEEDIIIIIII